MDDDQGGGGGGGNFLTSKAGPLAVWQWMAIVTVLAVGYYFLYAKNQNAAAAAASTTSTAATTSSADVPQFVIQNQIPGPVSAPAPAAVPVNVTVNDTEPVPAPATPSAPSKTPTVTKPAGHGTVKVTKWTAKHPPWQSTIAGIASHYGIRNWQTVWNDPKNAQLRAKRKSPSNIQPGDTVFVP